MREGINRIAARMLGEKSTFPGFTAEQRDQLESSCEAILQQEDFGRKDFDTFVEHMLGLVASSGDRLPIRFARLEDSEAKVSVDLTELNGGGHAITVHGDPRVVEETDVFHSKTSYEKLYERISYLPPEKAKDFRPTLTTIVRFPSTAIQFDSYFRGKPERLFAREAYDSYRSSNPVSNKDIQSYCAKVYNLYTRNK